jgi:hypothetical protein
MTGSVGPYTVSWVHGYVADGVEQAAKLALKDMKGLPESKLTIVAVKNDQTGEEFLVDLEYDPPRLLKLSM